LAVQRPALRLVYDPGQCEAVFGKDHAQTGNPGHDQIQLKRIVV
jgi:hypothetical protein